MTQGKPWTTDTKEDSKSQSVPGEFLFSDDPSGFLWQNIIFKFLRQFFVHLCITQIFMESMIKSDDRKDFQWVTDMDKCWLPLLKDNDCYPFTNTING
jgi:hypothetical protein